MAAWDLVQLLLPQPQTSTPVVLRLFFWSTTENRKSKWACDCSSSSSYPKSYRGFVAWCLGKFLRQNLHTTSHRLHIWLFYKGRYISACSMMQTCVLWKSRSVRRVSRILCQSARWVWSSLP